MACHLRYPLVWLVGWLVDQFKQSCTDCFCWYYINLEMYRLIVLCVIWTLKSHRVIHFFKHYLYVNGERNLFGFGAKFNKRRHFSLFWTTDCFSIKCLNGNKNRLHLDLK